MTTAAAATAGAASSVAGSLSSRTRGQATFARATAGARPRSRGALAVVRCRIFVSSHTPHCQPTAAQLSILRHLA
jgi:hypothetical protein